MSAQSTDDPKRDAMTALQDHVMEMATTAIFFANVIANGVPDAMTLGQVQMMAERFLTAQVPVYRYWRGAEVSGPQHEAEGARQ